MTDPRPAEAAPLPIDADSLLASALTFAAEVTASLPDSHRIRVRDGIAITCLWASIRLARDSAELTRAQIADAMQRPLSEGGFGLSRGAAYERIKAMIESRAWCAIGDTCQIWLPGAGAPVPVRLAGRETARANHGHAYGYGDGMGNDAARTFSMVMHGASGQPDSTADDVLAAIAAHGIGSTENELQAIERLADWILAQLAELGETQTDRRLAIAWAAEVMHGGPPKQRVLALVLQDVRRAVAEGKIKRTPGAMMCDLLRRRGIHYSRDSPRPR